MPTLKCIRMWIPTLAAFTGGFIILATGVTMLLVLSFIRFDGREIIFDFLRDLAIALTVAGFVAFLFEIYHHLTYTMKTTLEAVDALMGEKITPAVWREVKSLIEERIVIRRNVSIRLSILELRDGELPTNEAILRVEHDYDLCGLSGRKVTFPIEHELDDQSRNDLLDMPRFEQVEINTPGAALYQAEWKELKRKCPNGHFSHPVEVEPSEGAPVHVRIQRLELVHIPGSYNLYTPEFIKGSASILVNTPLK